VRKVTIKVYLMAPLPNNPESNPGLLRRLRVFLENHAEFAGVFLDESRPAMGSLSYIQVFFPGVIQPPQGLIVRDPVFSGRGQISALERINRIARTYADLARVLLVDELNVFVIARDSILEQIQPMGHTIAMADGEIRCLHFEASTANRKAPHIVSDVLALRADD
jgi:hypothetical protein